MKTSFFIFVTITYIVLVGSIYYLYSSNQKAAAMIASTQVAPAPMEKIVALPAGAVKISECIPTEGEHWVRPQDIPTGPYYTAYNGKVLSVEYMFKISDLPGEETSQMNLPQMEAYMKKNNYDLKNFVEKNDKHFDLAPAEYHNFSIHLSAPHAGFAEPHIDLHIFLADETELGRVCPDAKLEEVYSPEVIKTIQENKIPFPGAPQQ